MEVVGNFVSRIHQIFPAISVIFPSFYLPIDKVG